MRRLVLARAAVLACCVLALPAAARAQMEYVYGTIHPLDGKDDYVHALLDEALTRTSAKYGPFVLRPVQEMPRNRQIRALESETGTINLAILGTAHGICEVLRPILIPVDKGLVGYRLLFIRALRQERFDAVRAPGDLKAISFGQNFTWDDVDILRANGITVQTGEDFEGLFQMLRSGRFDALPRGVGEIGREYAEHAPAYPDLRIERDLLIHYPLPVYFWFSRSPRGEALAARLEEGLRSMVADGGYDAIFWKYNRAAVQELDLAHRRMLQLDNPLLPADTPLSDARLWLTPDQLGLLSPSPP